jgi:hypothetical protein
MMKTRNLLLGTLLGLGLATSASTLLAQTLVTEIDADTLRVTQYKGKPPMKRITINRTDNPVAFAHYAELIDYNPQPLFAVERRGAPGKSLPRTSRRVSGDLQEVAEFARFEETQESGRVETRAWRGAPGKGIRR